MPAMVTPATISPALADSRGAVSRAKPRVVWEREGGGKVGVGGGMNKEEGPDYDLLWWETYGGRTQLDGAAGHSWAGECATKARTRMDAKTTAGGFQ